jgi:hypothetical protein
VAKLNLHRFSGHDSLVKKTDDFSGYQCEVLVKTIDSFGFVNVGLIKIDTEGYEIPVLLGAKQTILKWKPRLVIEVHTPYHRQIEKIIQILKQLGYSWQIKYKTGARQPQILADFLTLRFYIVGDSSK